MFELEFVELKDGGEPAVIERRTSVLDRLADAEASARSQLADVRLAHPEVGGYRILDPEGNVLRRSWGG